MPLESLSDNQINIHDLTLEQEKKPVTEWQKRYENLKDLGLWDEDSQFWYSKIDYDAPDPVSGPIMCRDQLIGILVESNSGNKDYANTLWRSAKDRFWDSANNQWLLWGENIDNGNTRMTKDQLYGIYVQSFFDSVQAEGSYQKLKSSAFADNLWQSGLTPDGSFKDIMLPLVTDQFIDILVRDQLGMKDGKPVFESLMNNDKMYKNDHWADTIVEKNNPMSEFFDPQVELLAVLAQESFDPTRAKRKYEELLKLPLYDNDKGLWHYGCIKGEQIVTRSYITSTQLLSVLCEMKFGGREADFENKTPDIPEVRSY